MLGYDQPLFSLSSSSKATFFRFLIKDFRKIGIVRTQPRSLPACRCLIFLPLRKERELHLHKSTLNVPVAKYTADNYGPPKEAGYTIVPVSFIAVKIF